MSFSLEEPTENEKMQEKEQVTHRNWVTTESWQQRTSQGLSLQKHTKLDGKAKTANYVVPLWSQIYRRLDTTEQWTKNFNASITSIGLGSAVSGNLQRNSYRIDWSELVLSNSLMLQKKLHHFSYSFLYFSALYLLHPQKNTLTHRKSTSASVSRSSVLTSQ